MNSGSTLTVMLAKAAIPLHGFASNLRRLGEHGCLAILCSQVGAIASSKADLPPNLAACVPDHPAVAQCNTHSDTTMLAVV